MACSRLLTLALVGVVDVCQSVTIRAGKTDTLTPDWIENVSFVLPMDFTPLDNQTSFYRELQQPHHHTAVVTFAGKRNTEYIDGAVMLGMSVQKYLPDYVRAALVIEGMSMKSQGLLKRGGWKLITVPNWDAEYCGEGCDQEFLGRWHDSFEKINIFRLPFKRVLFFDSDTYIFRARISYMVNLTLPTVEHIAMAKDGCKEEYNSGVMFFKPDLEVFRTMLNMVATRKREQILDQNLINSYYQGKIFTVDRMYNCVDTVGIQPGQQKPCEHHCSKNAVVSHFTGHPKPTTPKRRLLELVRRPGSPGLACMHTNFGSCGKWSEFYCDIRRHHGKLSTELQDQLKNTGHCCHPSLVYGKDKKVAHKLGYETCMECPATLKVWAPSINMSGLEGVYVKTSLPSRKFNGGRPVYINLDSDLKVNPLYLFFQQKQLAWSIGLDYRVNSAYAYAAMEAQCPRDTKYWNMFNGVGFERKHLNIRAHSNGNRAPKDTDHIAWNIHKKLWELERIVWENGELGNNSNSGETASDAAASGEEEQNATEGEETDVQNGTADSPDEDDLQNVTDKVDIDADDKETAEVDEKGGKGLADIDADEKETAAVEKKAAASEPAEADDDEAAGGGEE